MAEQDANIEASPDAASLQKGDNPTPSLKLGESGYNGLTVIGGNILEEYQYELRWPYIIPTLKEMAKDVTIAPALSLFESQVARSNWSVKIPKGYEDELKEKANFVRQCMKDMDHTWEEFIEQASSFIRYGFSVHEKVYRRRLKSRGSKYNDGLIGWKKLPIRSQDTITTFEWDDTGRDITGVWQKKNIPRGKKQSPRASEFNTGEPDVFLKKDKILHFKTGVIKDNPLGLSPLVACWRPWKMRTALEEHELIGINQDLRGLKVIYIHPKYLDPNASVEDQAVGEYYRNIVRNLHNGDQSGVLLPSHYDENGNSMFKFDVVSITGQKAHDVDKVINRYNTSILTALTSDFLILGQAGGGSFALSETKMTISEIAIEAKLREIQAVLNHDLIPQLFALNGWDLEVLPYFEFDPVKTTSLDDLSSGIQRIAGVGLMPQTPKVVNWICDQLGIPQDFAEDMDREEFLSMLTKYESRSGDGLESDGPGTSNGGGSGVDPSVANNEN
jgi:hypothetical protein